MSEKENQTDSQDNTASQPRGEPHVPAVNDASGISAQGIDTKKQGQTKVASHPVVSHPVHAILDRIEEYLAIEAHKAGASISSLIAEIRTLL
jgi:hypothetical protein